MPLFEYSVTIQHDHGQIRIRTTAFGKDPDEGRQTARQKVMRAEGCPERAIKSVRHLKTRGIYLNQLAWK